MLVCLQRVMDHERARDGLEQRRFLALGDAEDREAVMAALGDAFVGSCR